MLWGRRWIDSTIVAHRNLERSMTLASLPTHAPVVLDHDRTLVVVELSLKSWLVAALVPGVERRPRQKLLPEPEARRQLSQRWRAAATTGGQTIARVAVACEAGRDGFGLARWLRSRGVECHVIHPASVAVSREGRRAKTDRLDTALLMRAFLGWLRGELEHCRMAAIPTLAEEDARRPNREHQHLMGERTRLIHRLKVTLARLGIRHFKPKLKRAIDRLAHLRTADGEPLPPNTLAEMRRDLERLQPVRAQIKGIEAARLADAAYPSAHLAVRRHAESRPR
ncbi:MAG: hypothetical protein ACLFTL_06965 [Alphaproteobacteria bacterium]